MSRSDQRDYAQAESLLKQVVALDSVNVGPMHPDLAAHLENLGYVYFQAKRYDNDIPLLKQTLAIRRTMLGNDNPAVARTIFNIAAALSEKGDSAGAEPMYEEAHARLLRALGPNHPDVTFATWQLGENQAKLGMRSEAERNLKAALAVNHPDGKLPPGDYARVASSLAGVLIDDRRYVEAEPLALRALASQDSLADTTRARRSVAQMVKLYDGWGKPDRAAVYRRRE